MAGRGSFFTLGATAFLFWAAITITTIAGWITHVVWCIKNEQFLFLIAGAIAAPVGIIHGWGLWFGWW